MSWQRFYRTWLDREGGLVNNPLDPGGLTNHGVIYTNWKRWGRDLDGDGNVTANDLIIATPQDVEPIVKRLTWDRVNGDLFNNYNLAAIVADAAGNHGATHGLILQKLLNDRGANLEMDNVVGPKTVKEANARYSSDLYNNYRAARKLYYTYRVGMPVPQDWRVLFEYAGIKPRADQSVFYEGWINRVYKFPLLEPNGNSVLKGVAAIMILGLIFGLV